ncbi:hypothetical protein [uncultured Rothia sp.]|uniref:hypothetical protein n=1 Tax=uncultured Rothia sp. TaxID=316088 RepID=UPI002613FF82|nr:hypothetical protein [uncultured Rothia sp.]
MKVIQTEVIEIKTAEEIFEAAMNCAGLMRDQRDEALEALTVKDEALAKTLEERWQKEADKMVADLESKMDTLCGGKLK